MCTRAAASVASAARVAAGRARAACCCSRALPAAAAAGVVVGGAGRAGAGGAAAAGAAPSLAPAPGGASARFRVCTWNVLAPLYAQPGKYHLSAPADLDAKLRLARLKQQLEAEVALGGIVCLQEVSLAWAAELQAFFARRGYSLAFTDYASESSGFAGVAVAFPATLRVLDVEIAHLAEQRRWPKEYATIRDTMGDTPAAHRRRKQAWSSAGTAEEEAPSEVDEGALAAATSPSPSPTPTPTPTPTSVPARDHARHEREDQELDEEVEASAAVAAGEGAVEEGEQAQAPLPRTWVTKGKQDAGAVAWAYSALVSSVQSAIMSLVFGSEATSRQRQRQRRASSAEKPWYKSSPPSSPSPSQQQKKMKKPKQRKRPFAHWVAVQSKRNRLLGVRLQDVATGVTLNVATFHAPRWFWDNKAMVIHTALAAQWAERWARGGPLAFAGDFNMSPGNGADGADGAYMLMTRGSLREEHDAFPSTPAWDHWRPDLHRPFSSAYALAQGVEPHTMLPQPRVEKILGVETTRKSMTLDYIFLKGDVVVESVQKPKAAIGTTLPNRNEPSDHLLIAADLRVRTAPQEGYAAILPQAAWLYEAREGVAAPRAAADEARSYPPRNHF